MNTLLILWFLFVHWVADFICQPHDIATSKWNDPASLMIHGLIYALVVAVSFVPVGILLCTCLPQIELQYYVIGVVATTLLHPAIDFFTSKAGHIYFEAQDYHNGFVVVGIDQMMHMAVFFAVYGFGPKLFLLLV